MKFIEFANWITATLSMSITLVSLSYLPDIVPIHFGLDGSVNRYGNKYEFIIVPVVAFAFHLFWRLMCMIIKKDKLNTNIPKNITAIDIINFIFNLFMIGVTIDCLIKIFISAEIIEYTIDYIQIVSVLLSYMLSITGAILPHLKANYFIGIRTKLTIQSNFNWIETHKHAAGVFLWGGLVSAILCSRFSGIISVILFSLFATVVMISSYLISYKIGTGDISK